MSTGFIYVVTTLSSAYMQENFHNVPTEWEGCLYFGPCKVPMRRKVRPDDYLFGVSPANLKPRRIVFATRVEEVLSFRDAYENFPQLRGPEGPIHVKPVNREQLSFPENKYEHIPGAMHPKRWKKDIRTSDLDAFFVCCQGGGWFGRWLGEYGPEVDEEILDFFRTCSIYSVVGRLNSHNEYATLANPIVHRGPRGLLHVGLHLETDNPERLVKLCSIRLSSHPPRLEELLEMLPKREVSIARPCSCDCSGNSSTE